MKLFWVILVSFSTSTWTVLANSHFMFSKGDIDSSASFSGFDLDGPNLFSVYKGSSDTETLSVRNLDSGIETIIDTDGSTNSIFSHPRISSGNTVWVEKNYDLQGNYTNSSVRLNFPDNEIGRYSSVNELEVGAGKVLVGFPNSFLPANFYTDEIILIDNFDGSQVTLTEFYAMKGSVHPRFAFTEGQYACLEFNDKFWSTNSNPEKLIFNDGTTITTITFPELNAESPLLIMDESLFFVDEDKNSISRLHGGIVFQELPMEPSENLDCLVRDGDRILVGINNPTTDSFVIHERGPDGSFRNLVSMAGELEEISLSASGIFFSADNAGKSLYYFQEGKGVSNLDVLNYFSRGIYSYGNMVINRRFAFRDMAPVTLLVKRVVEEISLPLPEEYIVAIGFNFGSNTVAVTSNVMQGKDLVLQATDDLNGEWIDADSIRYLYDGIATPEVSLTTVIDQIIAYKELLDPSLTPEEVLILRPELENGPLFFRSQLRY